MFITNQLTRAEKLFELFNLEGYWKAGTECSRKLRHKNDLYPGFREHANVMLDEQAGFRRGIHRQCGTTWL